MDRDGSGGVESSGLVLWRRGRGREASVHHMRTHHGRQDIDLIVARGDRKVLAI